MKKILLTTTIVLSIASVGCSDKSNVKSEGAHSNAMHRSAVGNKHMAHHYNRNNSVSTEDIQNLGGTSYNSVLAMAKAEQEKAKKVGGEWNTIRKLMKKAKKDHNAGNDDAAIKKLNKAIKHAKLGIKQSADQANAGPRF